MSDNGILVRLIEQLIVSNRQRYKQLCDQYEREFKKATWLSPGVMRYRDGYTGTLSLLKELNDSHGVLRELLKEGSE
jgi:hypothetical protein